MKIKKPIVVIKPPQFVQTEDKNKCKSSLDAIRKEYIHH